MGEATNPDREVSANYWISNSGVIIPHIDETRRAWTTGGPSPAGAVADHRSITVEVSNSLEGVRTGTWAISPAARDALERLIGDVFKRHGLGKVKRSKTKGVAVHRDFQATSCPGPYIMANLNSIIKNAEKHRTGKTVPKGSTVSAKTLWGLRGRDYVNKKPSTKDHQLAKAHEYTHKQPTRVWARRVKPLKTVTDSFPGVSANGFRMSTWVQYAYRWARLAANRAAETLTLVKRVDARVERLETLVTAMAKDFNCKCEGDKK